VHAFAERPPAGSRFACLREAASAKAGHAGVVPKNRTHLRPWALERFGAQAPRLSPAKELVRRAGRWVIRRSAKSAEA